LDLFMAVRLANNSQQVLVWHELEAVELGAYLGELILHFFESLLKPFV
jgi:hypothetical protein